MRGRHWRISRPSWKTRASMRCRPRCSGFTLGSSRRSPSNWSRSRPRSRPWSRPRRVLPNSPRSSKAFPESAARPLLRSLPPCRNSGKPTIRSLRPCWVSPLTMTTVDDVEASATSRADAAGLATCSIYGLSWGGDTAQSSSEGLLQPPGCQGERKEGGADRLHAQTDQHSQHHDRAAPEVGRQSVCSELIERQLCARSPTERLQDQNDR